MKEWSLRVGANSLFLLIGVLVIGGVLCCTKPQPIPVTPGPDADASPVSPPPAPGACKKACAHASNDAPDLHCNNGGYDSCLANCTKVNKASFAACMLASTSCTPIADCDKF